VEQIQIIGIKFISANHLFFIISHIKKKLRRNLRKNNYSLHIPAHH